VCKAVSVLRLAGAVDEGSIRRDWELDVPLVVLPFRSFHFVLCIPPFFFGCFGLLALPTEARLLCLDSL